MTNPSDSELVSRSLTGNREAFGDIVSRYQTLVCSVAFSGTGSLSQSEDVAQETFIAAWKQLGGLREPEKLRPWLCGIARNLTCDALRKQGREPSHGAEPLDALAGLPTPELQPVEITVSNEEAVIMWRSLERIPDIYREPLVLFYREHKSIESVALSLDLTEDTVKQRLSRGRKMLHEQVIALVEGTLERTNPGRTFTIGVLASLPALTFSAKAAAATATAMKGGATMKAAASGGLLTMLSAPLMVFFGNYLGYKMGLDEAGSEEERGYIRSFYGKVCLLALLFFGVFMAATAYVYRGRQEPTFWFMMVFVGAVLSYLVSLLGFAVAAVGKRRIYQAKILEQRHGGAFPKPAWEYCSRLSFLGLPLINIRIGDRYDLLKPPVKGWIAAGNNARGGLIAFGAVAIAPFSVGCLAIGIVPFGGMTCGVFPMGGIALGLYSFGALAIGWQSIGCFAIALQAAMGCFAMAHQFATGDIARAAECNSAAATYFMNSQWYFGLVQAINRHWFFMNLVWLLPLFIQSRIIARNRQNQG